MGDQLSSQCTSCLQWSTAFIHIIGFDNRCLPNLTSVTILQISLLKSSIVLLTFATDHNFIGTFITMQSQWVDHRAMSQGTAAFTMSQTFLSQFCFMLRQYRSPPHFPANHVDLYAWYQTQK